MAQQPEILRDRGKSLEDEFFHREDQRLLERLRDLRAAEASREALSKASDGQHLTVFADLVNKRVVFATEGKDHSTFTRFVEEILNHNGHPKAITAVAKTSKNPSTHRCTSHQRQYSTIDNEVRSFHRRPAP